MNRHQWTLLLLIVALVVYELIALGGAYPPITHTVAAWPFLWVYVLAVILAWMAVHFLRAHHRRKRQ